MEYNLPPAIFSVRLTCGNSAPRLSSSSLVILLLRGADVQVYSFLPVMCVVVSPLPQLLLRVFIDSFQHRLSIHQYTQWGTFPVVSGTAFLSGCDPCPVLRFITLSFHFHCLECCSSLYTTSVCIVLMSQPRQGSDNPVSQDKISNNRH